jgi:HAD superfamily hydrolase (TIGR01484 family)
VTRPAIRLLLADVDGTLVTSDKVLTDRAINAARRLGDAGVRLAVTSGRPPRGMSMLVEPLALTTPVAAFNGGVYAQPDMSVLAQKGRSQGVSAWSFSRCWRPLLKASKRRV